MEKKENWIKEALNQEVNFSKSSISEELIMNLKMISQISAKLSWKEISWMAASIALLITLNFSVLKSSSSSETSKTERLYNSYFSPTNIIGE